jgi:nitroreductase
MSKETPLDYSIHPLIEARWSPRSFRSDVIDDQLIKQCLEAARWAASCSNEQPWHFIVVSRRDDALFQKALACLAEGNQIWAKSAGALIFGVTRSFFKRNQNPNGYAAYDLGQSVAYFTLQATHLGLGTHQMAGFDADQCRQTFKVPTEYQPQVAIAIGYPDQASQLPDPFREREEAPRTRLSQTEFSYWGEWPTQDHQ